MLDNEHEQCCYFMPAKGHYIIAILLLRYVFIVGILSKGASIHKWKHTKC